MVAVKNPRVDKIVLIKTKTENVNFGVEMKEGKVEN